MQAGKLDRRVQILRPVGVQEAAYGTRTVSWEELATVWGQVTDLLPSRGERIAEAIEISRRPCRVRMRWRDDVTAAMRLQIGTRVLRIIGGPAEIGRRKEIEIVAEDLTTEGDEL